MIPDRIGIIGNTQGVSESSRPKPKKLTSTNARLPPLNRLAMRELSSPGVAEAGTLGRPEVGAGATPPGNVSRTPAAVLVLVAAAGSGRAARSSFASCLSGG